VVACGTLAAPKPDTTSVRYLALGDSYTIGTGASDSSHNYPSLLALRVAKATGTKVSVTNPAVNGFTTLNLIDRELAFAGKLKPELVSILIGVNDLVQGRTPDQYRASLVKIYDTVGLLKLPAGRVVAISIPDWYAVPAAADYGDPVRIRSLTGEFNAVARDEATRRGFTWVDITAVSTSEMGTPGWIASDGLHPGDAQYAAWADAIWSLVSKSWAVA
jgi:acyl-CoA thioesterase I